MERFGWQFLPYAGGVLDQPDWLMEDLFVIAWRKECVERMLKGPGGGSAEVTRHGIGSHDKSDSN
jgi:hypothetical protein